ncbi:MAG: ribonuclease P protein component [Cellvibrionaceae bacterium]|nr:ribonuclease P protein component [Cellvibrionaceae bacterium]
MPDSFSFSKHQRLLVASDFSAVFDKPNYRISNKHCLLLAKNNADHNNRLGMIIAKKHSRLAVDRNRIKRLVRESFRHQQHNLPGIDAIVLARRGLDQLSNRELNTLFKTLWRKIEKKSRPAHH